MILDVLTLVVLTNLFRSDMLNRSRIIIVQRNLCPPLQKNAMTSAESTHHSVLSSPSSTDKQKDEAINALAAQYLSEKNATALADLVVKSRTFLASLPKARTAKLTKQLIDNFGSIPNSQTVQIQVTKDCIAWAEQDKRVFLKQSLETRLASLFEYMLI